MMSKDDISQLRSLLLRRETALKALYEAENEAAEAQHQINEFLFRQQQQAQGNA